MTLELNSQTQGATATKITIQPRSPGGKGTFQPFLFNKNDIIMSIEFRKSTCSIIPASC